MEDACPDDGRAGARHFRWRASGPWWAERRGDPAAADLYHGSDLGHRDAVLHLLGRVVRRRNHIDPVQHSRGSLVGRDHFRRLSDGAAGPGGGSAHGGFYLILHWFAGGGASDYVPGADDLVVCVEVRA